MTLIVGLVDESYYPGPDVADTFPFPQNPRDGDRWVLRESDVTATGYEYLAGEWHVRYEEKNGVMNWKSPVVTSGLGLVDSRDGALTGAITIKDGKQYIYNGREWLLLAPPS